MAVVGGYPEYPTIVRVIAVAGSLAIVFLMAAWPVIPGWFREHLSRKPKK